jgi:hypothetical protein
MFKQFGGTAAVRDACPAATSIKTGGIPEVEFPDEPLTAQVLDRMKQMLLLSLSDRLRWNHEAGHGEYQYLSESHKPEYETLGMFEATARTPIWSRYMITISARYGLDTISQVRL